MGKRKSSVSSRILSKEERLEALARRELAEIKTLEREVKQGSAPHPLVKITYHDVARSAIGALIGTVGHFAFFYGVELARQLSVARAVFLYIFSFVVVLLFMYYSGFRKVKTVRVLHFIPVRALVVYTVSLVVVFSTLFLFGFLGVQSSASEIFKIMSTNTLLAVLGATTADMLGRD